MLEAHFYTLRTGLAMNKVGMKLQKQKRRLFKID